MISSKFGRAVARPRVEEAHGTELPDDLMRHIEGYCDFDTRMRIAMARKDTLLAAAVRLDGAVPRKILRRLAAPVSGDATKDAPPDGVAAEGRPPGAWPWGRGAPTMALDVVGLGLGACAALCRPQRPGPTHARVGGPSVVAAAAATVNTSAAIWREVDAARSCIACGDVAGFDDLLADGLWLGRSGAWGGSILAELDARHLWTLSPASGRLTSRLGTGDDEPPPFLFSTYFFLCRKTQLLARAGQLQALGHLDRATALEDGRMHPVLAMVIADVDDVDGPVHPSVDAPADGGAWERVRARAKATWSLSRADRNALFPAAVV